MCTYHEIRLPTAIAQFCFKYIGITYKSNPAGTWVDIVHDIRNKNKISPIWQCSLSVQIFMSSPTTFPGPGSLPFFRDVYYFFWSFHYFWILPCFPLTFFRINLSMFVPLLAKSCIFCLPEFIVWKSAHKKNHFRP